jgi:Protein of unknown function (DUF3551)
MKKLLSLGVAAIACAAYFGAAAPAAAGEYCRKDVTSAVVGCSFDTLAQCQAMSSGRGGDCFRDPFLPERKAFAYAPKAAAKRVKHHQK